MENTILHQHMLVFIAQRYHVHANRNLGEYMFANHLFQALDPALLDFACTNRTDICAYLSVRAHVDDLVNACVRATKRYTYQRNQFINYNKQYDQLLQAEYRDLFARLRDIVSKFDTRKVIVQELVTLVQHHHERLRLILASYCTAFQAADLAEHPLLQSVPCEEYSARFQLQVLGLDLAAMRQPILDIGCGAAGSLVTLLRQHGRAAFGIDRLAPAAPYFTQSDWFDFDYGQQVWGTVIAHQALSTHFIYNHLRQRGMVQRFQQVFHTILASLAPGGVFCYAPGLPFFEGTLIRMPQYTLTKIAIATPTMPELGEIAYAAQITAC